MSAMQNMPSWPGFDPLNPLIRDCVAAFPVWEGAGSKIHNVIDPTFKTDGIFNSNVQPSGWRKRATAAGQQSVLVYSSDVPNSYINCGNIPGFDFKHDEPWTVIACGSIANSAGDDRTLVAKWGADVNERPFLLRTDLQAAPTHIEVYSNGGLRISGGNIIELDTWYAWVVRNDGTGGANGLELRSYDVVGTLLESVTAQAATATTLTADVLLWGRTGNDAHHGLAGTVYLCERYVSDFELAVIARNNLAPLALAPTFAGKVLAAAGGVTTAWYQRLQERLAV